MDSCTLDMTRMDLRLLDMSGIEAVVAIRSRITEARFIILTTFAGDAEIQRALGAGARAYLLKTMSPQEMMDVIRQVHQEREGSLRKSLRILPSITVTSGLPGEK